MLEIITSIIRKKLFILNFEQCNKKVIEKKIIPKNKILLLNNICDSWKKNQPPVNSI